MSRIFVSNFLFFKRSSWLKSSSNVRSTFNQIQNIRKEYWFLKDFYSKEILNWKTYFQTLENTFQKGIDTFNQMIFLQIYLIEIQTTIEKYTKQINNSRAEIQQYQQQLKSE